MVKPFWNRKWGKDKICGISQGRLRPGKSKDGLPYVITLSCEHSFYRQALKIWGSQSFKKNLVPVCPLCRVPFNFYECFI